MLTVMQSLYQPLECVWLLNGAQLVCQWRERKAPAPIIESRDHLSADPDRKVA